MDGAREERARELERRIRALLAFVLRGREVVVVGVERCIETPPRGVVARLEGLAWSCPRLATALFVSATIALAVCALCAGPGLPSILLTALALAFGLATVWVLAPRARPGRRAP